MNALSPRQAYIDWLTSITMWTTKLDMTFTWNCNEFRARRLFSQWMRKQLPGSTVLYAIERDPYQDKVMPTSCGLNQACHVHAISDTKWGILREKRGIERRDLWNNWYTRYGMCRIEPVKHIDAATNYAMKKILNYSEAREDTKSHVRKTDVDWDLQFGKGKHAARIKDEASKTGQTFWSQIS